MHDANEGLLLAAVLSPQIVRWTVWIGLVALTVALLVLMRTRWGQSNPLRKYIVLSLVVHLLVGIYTTTVQIVTGGGSGGGDGQGIQVSLLDEPDSDASVATVEASSQPWTEFPNDAHDERLHATEDAAPPADGRHRDDALPDDEPVLPRESPEAASAERSGTPPAQEAEPPPAAPDLALSNSPPPDRSPSVLTADIGPPDPNDTLPQATAPALANLPVHQEAVDAQSQDDEDQTDSRAEGSAARDGDGGVADADDADPSRPHDRGGADRARPGHQTPREYQNRAGNRLQAALGNGGTIDSERAVAAALAWLAKHQSSDGRWSSAAFGGGAAKNPAVGDDILRGSGAGAAADTGITGLALLAFLAAGMTHESGAYRDNAADAIGYLVERQAPNGSLAGDAKHYERMYCHAMATFALSEALGMTGDPRLEGPVRKAIGYTLASQHTDGGWRYAPGDPGDTSQLGWQLMALKSADLAGLPMPEHARQGVIRFLNQVARGRAGGLACYRPGREPTPTMTAEALVCRQFLGLDAGSPAAIEAAEYLLQEPPGAGQANIYYWYYGTLALFRMQGPRWDRWNVAMQKAVLGSQRTAGDLKGSWDPDPTWGQYGGRVFNTALACLCLEVYYRYLPLQLESAQGGTLSDRIRNR